MDNKDLAFQVSNVSKIYRLGAADIAKENLGSVLVDLIKSPLKNYKKYRSLYKFSEEELRNGIKNSKSSDILWALKDVSFDVRLGETVGIIGRNGAGKSTLLKVLSRITHPTMGQIKMRGRIASLLEVGTGFHPELTGRENVYLNGTVLGMRKNEVDRKFDEIVEFSGVEKFLDTPVKRYSSGMRVRLAFAVAAHLEPEILIVDEVLAVGDAAFQSKCLQRMQSVSDQGRTVLFVSHNMAAVSRLCERGILLENGSVMQDGPIHNVVSTYMTDGTGTSAEKVWDKNLDAPCGSVSCLRAVRIINSEGKVSDVHDIRYKVGIQMEFDVTESGSVMLPHFYVQNDEGVVAFKTFDQDSEWRSKPRPKGHYVSTAWIPGNFLSEGTMIISCGLITLNPNVPQFIERQIVAAQIVDSMEGDSARGDWAGGMPGLVRPLLDWETNYTTDTMM
jgi:lipopolysaccharide transport system ATP-binding protein